MTLEGNLHEGFAPVPRAARELTTGGGGTGIPCLIVIDITEGWNK
ncbi:MAG: hypothetical protein ACRC62_22355 [Microcoleus sp.]